ncbi:hypothetical protein [Nocardioides sp.]|uniref:hypothetical protein n=1 Tax=Nocardioides sp. TaxID=35761 RepID=UPI00261A61E8|nr:hypothetical protein [Nocardioides sp.]MDI6911547.1 hypothetical protein [Nocardioides sp.]
MKSSVGGSSGGSAGEGQHEPLVEHLVSETMQRVPGSVTREELRSAGRAALAAASREHDPVHDGGFQRYAAARIRGALVDTLRSIDWHARGRQPLTPADPVRADRLRDALAVLPEDRRTVVEGYFLRQREVADLATDLGLDEREVARLRTDALRALSRTLGAAFAADRQFPASLSAVPASSSLSASSSLRSDSSGTGSPRILNRR